jgi:hypothetical protein
MIIFDFVTDIPNTVHQEIHLVIPQIYLVIHIHLVNQAFHQVQLLHEVQVIHLPVLILSLHSS